jgi:HlyD family secretion protein
MSKSGMQRSIKWHLAAGVTMTALLVCGFGGWAATTELAGAVIASGQLVVDSNIKKLQHSTGGIVSELLVREGDRVTAGQVVIRLDETQTRANFEMVLKSLDELVARQAREQSEQDGDDQVSFPADLLARLRNPKVSSMVEGERKLFEMRKAARTGQKSQLRAQIAEIEQQIGGLKEQVNAKNKEIDLVRQELKGVRELWQKNLVQFNRVTSLEREAARLEGERGSLFASIAQNQGKVAEINLRIIQIDEDMRTEVGKDLSNIRARISELSEKRIAAEDQLTHMEVHAPQDGIVHQLSTHTIGGFVERGELIMLIVPEADDLKVEAKIQPQDIDQVHLGQSAVVRFSSFNQRTTPELNGIVSLISPDVSQDQKTGATHYLIRVAISVPEVQRLGNVRLVPGMPVEVFVQTIPRTALSYLVRPVHDQMIRAFKEK